MLKYWCESCLCFVKENHRCESWPTTIIIKQEVIDAIRAEALRDAADIAVKHIYADIECQDAKYLLSAITQEAGK